MSEQEPKMKPEQPMNVRQLLQDHSIPFEHWGQGNAKTIEDLEAEVAAGDCALVTENQELLRKIDLLAIDVLLEDEKGEGWKLKEEKQVFSDGRVRQRNLDSSLGEKIKIDEDKNEAVMRAIQEELGQAIELDAIQYTTTELGERDSESFPGLKTKYEKHRYQVQLRSEQITYTDTQTPQGFTETQPDKTTYFEWEKIIKE